MADTMVAFIVLMFLLMMVVVGFVFDLYLYSRGEFGNKYVRNAKFTRPVASGPMLNCRENYESDAMYERPMRNAGNAGIGLVVLCAGFVVVMMIVIIVINFLA
jgi:hypothetical protein